MDTTTQPNSDAQPIENGLPNGGIPASNLKPPEDTFYPFQKSTYYPPNYRLSSESKRIIRKTQEPVLATCNSTVRFLYEVGILW